MLRRSTPNHSLEQAVRLGARDNLLLGIGQALTGMLTGNVGFMAEAGHQAADSFSLRAKAEALRADCSAKRSLRLRRFAAGVLVAGGLFGIAGGAKHIVEDTTEDHGSLELAAAYAGAVINTVVARRAHGTHHHEDDHAHNHSAGAALDSVVHMVTDMGTGVVYAGALTAERWVPGATNIALIINGAVIGTAGSHTLARVSRDSALVPPHGSH